MAVQGCSPSCLLPDAFPRLFRNAHDLGFWPTPLTVGCDPLLQADHGGPTPISYAACCRTLMSETYSRFGAGAWDRQLARIAPCNPKAFIRRPTIRLAAAAQSIPGVGPLERQRCWRRAATNFHFAKPAIWPPGSVSRLDRRPDDAVRDQAPEENTCVPGPALT